MGADQHDAFCGDLETLGVLGVVLADHRVVGNDTAAINNRLANSAVLPYFRFPETAQAAIIGVRIRHNSHEEQETYFETKLTN